MIKIYLDKADQSNLTSISKNAATKPEWLRVKAPQFERIGNTANLVEISGVTKGEISRTIYFHRAELSEMTGLTSTSIMIQVPDGTSTDGLSDVSINYNLKEDSIKTFESLLEQQQQFIQSIQFLGIVIAIAVLFNTLLMNLAERDTELATLRVLGAPMNKLGNGEDVSNTVAFLASDSASYITGETVHVNGGMYMA